MADEKQLFDLATETIDGYAERDQDYDALEDYYFLDGDQDPTQDADDEAVDIVRLPYITNVVDLVQDLFASAEWSISVPAGGEKVTDQQLADDAEEYLKVVFSQSQRAQRQDFLSRAAWLVAMRGCLAGRVMRVNDWLKKDSGRLTVGDKIPLLIQMRDPRYVYPEFGLDGLSYVVEQFTRTVGDVRRTYGEDVLAKKKRDEEIEWTEYWDGTHFYHWAAGDLVQSGEHLCGGIPYAYEFARQTGKIEPEKRGPYAGAVGYFSLQGNMDFCITIRTFFAKGDILYIQAGAGIVADSIPAREYTETENKAKGLMEAYLRTRGL